MGLSDPTGHRYGYRSLSHDTQTHTHTHKQGLPQHYVSNIPMHRYTHLTCQPHLTCPTSPLPSSLCANMNVHAQHVHVHICMWVWRFSRSSYLPCHVLLVVPRPCINPPHATMMMAPCPHPCLALTHFVMHHHCHHQHLTLVSTLHMRQQRQCLVLTLASPSPTSLCGDNNNGSVSPSPQACHHPPCLSFHMWWRWPLHMRWWRQRLVALALPSPTLSCGDNSNNSVSPLPQAHPTCLVHCSICDNNNNSPSPIPSCTAADALPSCWPSTCNDNDSALSSSLPHPHPPCHMATTRSGSCANTRCQG